MTIQQQIQTESLIGRIEGRNAAVAFWNLLFQPMIQKAEPFAKVSGGLTAIHNIHRMLFPRAFVGEGHDRIVASEAYRRGYATLSAGPTRVANSRKWIGKIEDILSREGVQRLDVNTIIRNDPELLREFERDWIEESYESVLSALGLENAAIIWNWLILKTSPRSVEADMGVSGRWHYDNHYPSPYFKIMYYLNDVSEHQSGTDFVDAETSLAISDRTGYVGPVFSRISDLSLIAPSAEAKKAFHFRPKEGDATVFWPGRVMHRGIYPKGPNPRYAVSLSLMPALKANLERNWQHYRELLSDYVTGSDPVAFFVDRYQHDTASTIYNWSGQLGVQEACNLILDAIRPEYLSSAGADGLKNFDLIAHLSRFIKRSNIDEFLNELFGLSNQLLPPDMRAPLERYKQSLLIDLSRYHQPETKDIAFWPDPTHSSRPRPLKHLKPFAKKYPILNRNTVIATAGSCFASEISAVLQERKYNYLVAERPDDPQQGVFIDGYNAGDPHVKFSGSYGLLFNSPSLLRLAQRAFETRDFKKILLPENNLFVDPYRENVYFKDIQAYWNDYPKHTAALRRVFTEAEVFVFTMGLNECWVFRDDKTAISRNPRGPLHPLVEHKRLTVAENISCVSEFFKLCRIHNPHMKLILTVSPVPFLATGLSETAHVVEANCHSKSVLRVAAQELVEQHEDIYYFPSYEMVMHTLEDPWDDDTRHIKRNAVREIIDVFYEMYGVAT